MPSRLRILMLACAFAALVFACSASSSPGLSGVQKTVPLGLERPTPPNPPKLPIRKPKPTIGKRAATIALQAVGVPYRWGGSSPAGGFDCSGLVYWAYGKLGVELPHSSYALYDLGRRVGRSRLKVGDLLFFYGLGHVGLYVGRGRMVHAPSSGKRVEVVKLGSSNYGRRLVGARRIVSG